MRQHASVFSANFSSNLLWQNCFAPKKSASCAEPRRVAAGILDVCQGGATTGLRETRLLRRMFSYARRPPINQIVGYILSEDPTYITNHNSARSLICKIDRDELLQVLVKSYLEL